MASMQTNNADQTTRGPKRNFASRLFGYDIFLSFALGSPPRGTLSYASDLARRLRERDFAVFFSEDEATPGEQLDNALRAALRHSRTLVVIANRGTLQEPRYVRDEVEEFRKRYPERPVIPINIGEALQDPALAESAQIWLGHQGKIWVDESEEAVTSGIASERVVARLATAPTSARSNVYWRWTVRAVGASLITLSVALGFHAWQLSQQRDLARENEQEAIRQRILAKENEDKATRNAIEADQQRDTANQNLERALAGEELARVNEGKMRLEAEHARKAEKRAHAELLRATGLRLTAEAQAMSVGARSGSDERALLQILAAHRISPGMEIDDGMWNALLAHRDMQLLIPVGAAVRTIVLSQDGKRFVSGGQDGSLQLRDAQTGQAIGTALIGHEGEVRSAAFSPDGHQLVSAGSDGTIRLWSVRNGLSIGEVLGKHILGAESVVYSPDGKVIVSVGKDGFIYVWDAISRGQIAKFSNSELEPMGAVAFSPDGRRLITVSHNGILRLWDILTHQQTLKFQQLRRSDDTLPHEMRILLALKIYPFWVRSVAFNHNGTRVVSGGDGNKLQQWDAMTGMPIGKPFTGHSGLITSVTYSTDGHQIISSSADGTIRIWDAASGDPVGTPLRGHQGWVESVAFRNVGKTVISGGRDATIRIWTVDGAHGVSKSLLPKSIEQEQERLISVAFSNNGKHVVSVGGDKHPLATLWDTESGDLICKFNGHEKYVLSVAFSPDDTRIASVSWDQSVRIWDAKNCQPLGVLTKGHTSGVMSIAYSPNGKNIVSGGWDNKLRLWNIQPPHLIDPPMEEHTGGVMSVAFSPDGKHIVSGGMDKSIRLWNVNSGKQIGTTMLHNDAVMSVAFSKGGSRIISASKDGILRLWDTKSQKPFSPPLTHHRGGIKAVAVCSESGDIVSAGFDKKIRFSDGATGQPIHAPLDGHQKAVNGVAINNGCTVVASVSDDGALRLWPAPKVWPDKLCSKLTRNMSVINWNEWVSPDIPYTCQCPGLPIAPDDPESTIKLKSCPSK